MNGLTGVIADLLTHAEGQELYRIPRPAELERRTARQALDVLKDGDDSLVGVFTDGHCVVNPAGDVVLAAGDELLVVRERPLVPR
jgi:Trk K+ transport system NAD-binding subunit